MYFSNFPNEISKAITLTTPYGIGTKKILVIEGNNQKLQLKKEIDF